MTNFKQMPLWAVGAAVAGLLAVVGVGTVLAEGRFDHWNGKYQNRRHTSVCVGFEAKDAARCHARTVTDDRGAPITNTVPSGYGPAQFRGAYNVTGVSSASPTPIIAVVDAYDHPRALSDLNTYSTTFGIPTLSACSGPIKNSAVPCFQKVNQYGSTSSLPRSNSGWDLEIALDIEAAHAMCQNCRLLLVEASSASYSSLMRAIDTAVSSGAQVVSNSWGSNEFSGENFYDSHFNKTGVAFTFSSGDSGYGTSYPAASPYVTAVGGTSLFVNPDNSYQSESVWGGAGSGCSSYEAKPGWQTDPLCARRTIADVSAVADPNTGAAVYDSVPYAGQSGWFQVGGTSLSSPIIAATYALGGVPISVRENSLPYSGVASLHDITTGSNGSCGGTYLCTASSGYDGPTGLGTPNGASAF